jgi:hypothetical protein
VLVDEAVRVVRRRQLELVEELEQPPDADAVAIVAPGIVAVRLRLPGLRRVVAEAGAEREPLDVRREDESEAPFLSIGPARPVVVPGVLRQERFQMLISSA